MFNAIVSADTLESFLEPVSALVEETKIHTNEDGLHIRAVDPANVAMIDTRLDEDAFESYEGDGGVFGINLDQFEDVIGVANGSDLVYLSLDQSTRKLSIECGIVDYTAALIDPDSIRQEPDLPDLDLPSTVVLEAEDLETGVKAADLCSDHISFGADADEKEFIVQAEGDTDDVDVAYGRGETIDADVDKTVRSLFSLDYVKDMVKPMPDEAEISVTVGDEFPVELKWDHCDGRATVHNQLAPRIKSE